MIDKGKLSYVMAEIHIQKNAGIKFICLDAMKPLPVGFLNIKFYTRSRRLNPKKEHIYLVSISRYPDMTEHELF